MKSKTQTTLRLLALLLALLMLCSLVLVSCKDNTEGDTPADGEQPGDQTQTTPVSVKESYMPAGLMDEVGTLLQSAPTSFDILSTANAPYAFRDVYTLSDCTLLSVTLPIRQTLAKDKNGNFRFTIHTVLNSHEGLKEAPVSTYEILINAAEYGLQENDNAVNKVIKVDLSDYSIKLTPKMTVAVLDVYDTVRLAALYNPNNKDMVKNNNAPLALMKEKFPESMGWWQKVGTEDRASSQRSMILDFEIERTYASEDAYNAALKAEQDYQNMVAELKTVLQGKTYSVVGDSISTMHGISNNTAYNTTIGDNNVYYNDARNLDKDGSEIRNMIFHDYTHTYWGRLTKDLGMELCVNNAVSGSLVYETSSARYKQNMYSRANQLHQDNGTPNDRSDDVNPDVIIIFMGTNDMLHEKAATSDKDLSSELHKLANTTTGVMEKWFADVKRIANAASSMQQGVAYINWEAGYALSLELMQKTYPDAEIVCLTLPQCNHTNSTDALVTMFNEHIRAIATYFGATIVETGEALPYETCHAYGADDTTVHPNVLGHKKMFEGIVKALYADKAKFAS